MTRHRVTLIGSPSINSFKLAKVAPCFQSPGTESERSASKFDHLACVTHLGIHLSQAVWRGVSYLISRPRPPRNSFLLSPTHFQLSQKHQIGSHTQTPLTHNTNWYCAHHARLCPHLQPPGCWCCPLGRSPTLKLLFDQLLISSSGRCRQPPGCCHRCPH